ncbi:two-component sensor histidine kinase [Clostridia bacterium]|nr:two-component sensor histidine kinase [Clostridia bacterium]
MFNSIFRKQFALYMGVILVSFLLVAVGLSLSFKSYFVQRKEADLRRQGEKISYLYTKMIRGGIVDYYEFVGQFEVISEYLDADFALVDRTGKVIAASEGGGLAGSKIDDALVSRIFEGNIVKTSERITGIFDEPLLTVGYPISVNGSVLAAILMSSSVPEMSRTIGESYKIGGICLALSLIPAFFMIYISSKTMSRPLREMNENAKLISGGNFDKTLTVKGCDEVAQLAESFNNMAKSLSVQETSRRDFLANISHDFRSPLTSIQGFLQAVLDGTIPKDKQDKYIRIVYNESIRLGRLATDILEINKQTLSIDLVCAEFDINELLRDVLNRFSQRVQEKNLGAKVIFADPSTYVFADYEKIERVIYNLIDNAVKFADAGGELRVETALLPQERLLKISIFNSGEIIPPEILPRIFERFYKGDNARSKDNPGAGLGLSIAKEFVNAHGGTLTAENADSRGTRFTFCLKSNII